MFHEVDNLFEMDEFNIIKFVTYENELVWGDCIWSFIIDKVSVIALICVKDMWHHIYLRCNVFVQVFGMWDDLLQ